MYDERNNESFDDDDNHSKKNSSDLLKDASNLVEPNDTGKENQTEKPQEGQEEVPKKWYQVSLFRPVAFRSTSNNKS